MKRTLHAYYIRADPANRVQGLWRMDFLDTHRAYIEHVPPTKSLAFFSLEIRRVQPIKRIIWHTRIYVRSLF